MSQTIEIIDKLEKAFTQEQARTLADVIIGQEEQHHDNLVTKDHLSKELTLLKSDLHSDMSEFKSLFYKEMGYFKDDVNKRFDLLRKEMSDLKDDLRKEMGSLKDDLRKEMIVQTRWFLAGIAFLVAAITLILKFIK